jgi:hypothetical protein
MFRRAMVGISICRVLTDACDFLAGSGGWETSDWRLEKLATTGPKLGEAHPETRAGFFGGKMWTDGEHLKTGDRSLESLGRK